MTDFQRLKRISNGNGVVGVSLTHIRYQGSQADQVATAIP